MNEASFWTRELLADRWFDDVTGRLLGERGKRPARGVIRAKEAGVFSGTAVAAEIAEAVPGLKLEKNGAEGKPFLVGDDVVVLSGPSAALLAVERTLLNGLTHLCGIATLTRKYVEAVRPHPTRVLATRKFLPGLREAQMTALRAGGGWVHRRSLSDGVLIKENHQALVSTAELVKRARASRSPLHRIEVEVQSLPALKDLMRDPPDVVMLDNFSLADMKEAIALVGGRCEVEVSGGVSLETIGPIAALGVHYVSVGRLTHSVPAVDLSMDVETHD